MTPVTGIVLILALRDLGSRACHLPSSSQLRAWVQYGGTLNLDQRTEGQLVHGNASAALPSVPRQLTIDRCPCRCAKTLGKEPHDLQA